MSIDIGHAKTLCHAVLVNMIYEIYENSYIFQNEGNSVAIKQRAFVSRHLFLIYFSKLLQHVGQCDF